MKDKKSKIQLIIIIVELIILVSLSGYRLYEYINKDSNTNENINEENNNNTSKDEEEKEEIKILVDQINIRREANENSEDIGDVYLNEAYEVLDIVETDIYTWYKIKKDNIVGYVANKKGENWIEVIYNDGQTLTMDSQLIKNLILPIKPFVGSLYFVTDYKDIIKNNFNVETVKNKDLLHITLQYMYVSGELQNDKRDGLLFIDFAKINAYAKKIWGSDIELQPESIKVVSGCLNTDINYSEENNGYWINESYCGGTVPNTKVFMDMISAKKENNDIILEYVVFLTRYNTYDISLPFATRSLIIYDFRDDTEINSVSLKINTDSDDSENELEKMLLDKISELKSQNKLPLYKATFKKQSDGNYYFTKGEWQ